MLHELKTHPKYFKRIFEGSKKFEVRSTLDRDFQTGDTLKLQEWCPETKEYTGNEIWKQVGYILHGGEFGIAEGNCVMSLIDL